MREYQRSFGKSYMIVSKEEWIENYQLPMIEQNDIQGLLPLKKVPGRTGVQFWYDITGKNSIDMYMENHRADAELLEKLLSGLQRTCSSMREYLLDESGICLEPEDIYIGNTNDEIYFCYQVCEQNKFELKFRNFMEFFLQKMEHTNQESVRKCYGIYDCCARGHFELDDLVKEFYQKDDAAAKQEIPASPIRLNGNTDYAAKEADLEDAEDKDNKKKGIKERFNLSTSYIQQNIQNYISKLPRAIIKFKKEKQQKSNVIMFEPSAEEEIQISNPTIFLGSETTEILGQLKYEGNQTASNFSIDKSPFVLGIKANEVDGLLTAATVSRIHAKITRDEKNNYYIEDMNSTNGTYINGTILNYREIYKLCKNDTIQFADIPYRFV